MTVKEDRDNFALKLQAEAKASAEQIPVGGRREEGGGKGGKGGRRNDYSLLIECYFPHAHCQSPSLAPSLPPLPSPYVRTKKPLGKQSERRPTQT